MAQEVVRTTGVEMDPSLYEQLEEIQAYLKQQRKVPSFYCA